MPVGGAAEVAGAAVAASHHGQLAGTRNTAGQRLLGTVAAVEVVEHGSVLGPQAHGVFGKRSVPRTRCFSRKKKSPARFFARGLKFDL